MADTPGRLLSSLSNGDGKPPKVGGCVGVFFQLFDWNRRFSKKHLFSTKSLPAERPQLSRNKRFSDDKLPMAKLLLIADENRGGFPRTPGTPSSCSSDVESCKHSDVDSQSSKRTPGVVARLMGLEYLPDKIGGEKQHKRQLQQNEFQMQDKHEQLSAPSSVKVEQMQNNRKERNMPTSESMLYSKRFKMREEKMPKKFTSRKAVPPRNSGLPSVMSLSRSKSVSKLGLPFKSQCSNGSRTRSLILEAAAKILEPNMQPQRRPLTEKARNSAIVTSNKKSSINEVKGNLRQSNRLVHKNSKNVDSSTKQCSGSIRSATASATISSRSSSQGPKEPPNKGDHSEHDDNDDCISMDVDSHSSSEPPQTVVKLKVARLTSTLGRSGSVKEEQPPTPPSRGSLVRSTSVREGTASSELNPKPKISVAEKQNRLKRERQQCSSKAQCDLSRRKPPLDQGEIRTSRKLHGAKDGQKRSTTGLDAQNSTRSSALNYGTLFGRKEDISKKEDTSKIVETPKKSDTSLVKSILRRKSKPAKHTDPKSVKAVSRPSDGKRSVKAELNDPEFVLSPEKPQGVCDAVHVQTDMTDKSLEEILKTILSKSLGKGTLKEESDSVHSEAKMVDAKTETLEQEKQVQSPAVKFASLPQVETCDVLKESASSEDAGQPSPVSVLNFLLSPFPSDSATSSEGNDEEGVQLKDQDEDDCCSTTAKNAVNSNKIMEAIMDISRIRSLDLSETEQEDANSCQDYDMESYVRDVLTRSGLVAIDPSSELVSREEVFQRLEAQHRVCQEDEDYSGSACDRLMLDCIEESMELTLAPYRDDNALFRSTGIGKPCGEELVGEVCRHIMSWRDMTLGMVDDLVEKDISTCAGKWMQFSEDNMQMCLDVERIIFRTVIEDLISDLVGIVDQ